MKCAISAAVLGLALVASGCAHEIAPETREVAVSAPAPTPNVGPQAPTQAKKSIGKGAWRRHLPAHATADAVGAFTIPSLGVREHLIDSDFSDEDLDRGLALYSGSASPGQPGQVNVAGHRGPVPYAPLTELVDVKAGAKIKIWTAKGRTIYRVLSTRVVDESDVSVMAAAAPGQLTINTCRDTFRSPRRFVVFAKQISHTPVKDTSYVSK